MIAIEPIAVSVDQAAQLLGVSPECFRNQYVATGRVRPVLLGQHELIPVSELRTAFVDHLEELREQ